MAERVYREHYKAPAFFAERVDLEFDIRSRSEAIVTLRMAARRSDPDSADPLELDGEGIAEGTLEIALDGVSIPNWREFLSADSRRLSFPVKAGAAEFLCRVRLDPSSNLALEGLYASESGLFTQCEAQGFRRIAWSVDRPDSLPRWGVRVEADAAEFPVLLSNGPKTASGSDGSRHWARFEDPFPKPTYLFALVAGDLASVERTLPLLDGSSATLFLWSKPADLSRLSYAMDALEQSILWDRRRFGLDLDLSEYHVVAVPDFNMGAMENKGLNIFNSKALLADPLTASDDDYARVQAIVAHEYFHNWTGNRATVRDWFELTLKEGLTVYRDQEFSSEMRSPSEQRVRQALGAIASQFPEDAGPLRHSPRPASYERIDNFYTSTVYEKGAEIVRCLENLVGREAFDRGVKLYLTRNDGKAGVCEDLSNAIREASGDPLEGFERWWSQSGTPTIQAECSFDSASGILRAEISQTLPDQETGPAEPLLIPIGAALAYRGWLLRFRPAGSRGAFGREAMLRLSGARQTFLLEIDPAEGRLLEAPVLSLLRGFSAPAILVAPSDPESVAQIALAETDAWARKSAIDSLMLSALEEILRHGPGAASDRLAKALASAFASSGSDGFLLSLMMAMPSDETIAARAGEEGKIHPLLFWRAKRSLRRFLASALRPALRALAERSRSGSLPYAPEGPQAADRAIRWAAMSWLAELPESREFAVGACLGALASADNATDRLGALSALCLADRDAAASALESFREAFSHEPALLDKWLSLLASPGFSPDGSLASEAAFRRFPELWKNPNRARALATGLIRNPEAFHRPDGEGYRLLAALAASVDRNNPKSASGLLRVFAKSAALQEPFRSRMRSALSEAAAQGLSEESSEIASLILGPAG